MKAFNNTRKCQLTPLCLPAVRIAFLLYLAIGNAAEGLSQTHTIEGTSGRTPLKFDLDTALFRYDEERVYVEVYYGVSSDRLTVIEETGEKAVSFEVELEVYRRDSLEISRKWSTKSLISTEDEQAGDKLVTLTKLVLHPETYTLTTTVTDVGSGASSQKELNFTAEAFPEAKLAISDIELAYSVSPDTGQGIYTKHSYQVLPNPDALYDSTHPVLYFYAEIYNLKEGSDSTYTVQCFIEDEEHNVLKSFPARTRQLYGVSVVEVGGLNVVSLPAGVYDLRIVVTDSADRRQALKRKRFYIFRERNQAQSEKPGGREVVSGYYASVSEGQVLEEFDMAKYLASDEEKRLFETLDLTGKRAFLEQFWSKRSREAGVPFTDSRRRYLLRVKAANQRFSNPQRLGWKTDRGRVLILYGDPDEIERNANVSEGRGFELWDYRSGQREMVFVFAEKRGWADLELVHSTARGEVFDPDWERWIKVK